MNRSKLVPFAVALIAVNLAWSAFAADPPADRVIAMYFHRTQRCPTCPKMGSYADEAVKQGFAAQMAAGTVAFHYVDFQNPKNAALTSGYQITGPALIIAKIKANQVQEYKNLPDIWTKVREKPAFLQYVRESIEAYQEQ